MAKYNLEELIRLNYDFQIKLEKITNKIIEVKNKSDFERVENELLEIKKDSKVAEERINCYLEIYDYCSYDKLQPLDIQYVTICNNIKNCIIELSFAEQHLKMTYERIKTQQETKNIKGDTEKLSKNIENFRTATLGQIISIMGVLIAIISIIITTLNGSNEALTLYIKDCIENERALLNTDFYMMLVATPSVVIIFSTICLLIISGLIFGDKSVRTVIISVIFVCILLGCAISLLDANKFISILAFFFSGLILVLLELKILNNMANNK